MQLRNVLINLDEALGSLLFEGIGKDETISAYVWRKQYKKLIMIIDFFFGKGHCQQTYEDNK